MVRSSTNARARTQTNNKAKALKTAARPLARSLACPLARLATVHKQRFCLCGVLLRTEDLHWPRWRQFVLMCALLLVFITFIHLKTLEICSYRCRGALTNVRRYDFYLANVAKPQTFATQLIGVDERQTRRHQDENWTNINYQAHKQFGEQRALAAIVKRVADNLNKQNKKRPFKRVQPSTCIVVNNRECEQQIAECNLHTRPILSRIREASAMSNVEAECDRVRETIHDHACKRAKNGGRLKLRPKPICCFG